MAKILVFDNDPEGKYNRKDTADETVPWDGVGLNEDGLYWDLDTTPYTPARTMPVRALTRGRDVVYVGWEFLLRAPNWPTEYQLVIRWWQEFYGDRRLNTAEEGGTQIVSPRNRKWPDVDPNTPWMRETCVVDSGTTGMLGTRLLSMFAVERAVRMRNRIAGPPGGDQRLADSLYFPLPVHASWVRLGFYVDQDLSDADTMDAAIDGALHLRIFAHVGGHDEISYLEKYGYLPYAYNAYE